MWYLILWKWSVVLGFRDPARERSRTSLLFYRIRCHVLEWLTCSKPHFLCNMFSSCLYECPMAEVTNDHKISGLKQTKRFSFSSGGQKSTVIWQGYLPSGGSGGETISHFLLLLGAPHIPEHMTLYHSWPLPWSSHVLFRLWPSCLLIGTCDDTEPA